jgi:hypothetical protein
MLDIKVNNNKKIDMKYNYDVLKRLKHLILSLKSFLTSFLKTSIAIGNLPLKLLIIFAIGMLQLNISMNKGSIIKLDSKGNVIDSKLPAKSSKKYITFFINICYSLLYLADIREEIAYKILIFSIINEYIITYINIKEIALLKSYLKDVYASDKFMISNVINKLSVNNLVNYKFVDLLNKFKNIIL